jgi:SAM-dependent methyltransferase
VADLSARLPLADASLAGATLIEVIEHIACAEALMAELGRVIRPGGWLILTTPNIAHLTYRWRALTGHPPKQEGYHVRFFTRKTLSALLDTAGFERVASASYGKQALLTKLAKPLHGRHAKVHYRVPGRLEGLLARHFVWKLVRRAEDSDALRAEDLPSPS